MITRTSICFTLFIAVLLSSYAHAQQPVKASGTKKTSPDSKKSGYRVVLVPEFFHPETVKDGDTAYTYECYDKDLKKINLYELTDINAVKSIFYYKSFFQYQTKPGSVMSAPYLSKKLYSYERTGKDSWVGINGFTNEQTGYKEYRSRIVRMDTMKIFNPLTSKKVNFILKYYRADKGGAKVPAPTHSHSH